jgi:hypothetical protein
MGAQTGVHPVAHALGVRLAAQHVPVERRDEGFARLVRLVKLVEFVGIREAFRDLVERTAGLDPALEPAGVRNAVERALVETDDVLDVLPFGRVDKRVADLLQIVLARVYLLSPEIGLIIGGRALQDILVVVLDRFSNLHVMPLGDELDLDQRDPRSGPHLHSPTPATD